VLGVFGASPRTPQAEVYLSINDNSIIANENFFRISMTSMQLLRCIVMLFDQASSMQKEEENMQLKVAHQPLGKAVTTLG